MQIWSLIGFFATDSLLTSLKRSARRAAGTGGSVRIVPSASKINWPCGATGATSTWNYLITGVSLDCYYYYPTGKTAFQHFFGV